MIQPLVGGPNDKTLAAAEQSDAHAWLRTRGFDPFDPALGVTKPDLTTGMVSMTTSPTSPPALSPPILPPPPTATISFPDVLALGS